MGDCGGAGGGQGGGGVFFRIKLWVSNNCSGEFIRFAMC